MPPISEAGFRRKYFTAWMITGAACIIVGLALGPRIKVHSHTPWISVVAAVAVYLISLLLAPIMLMRVWTKPAITPAVLFFSIPVGVACILVMIIMRRMASQLQFTQLDLIGLAFALGFLYAAALIWGMTVGIHRKQMGDILVKPRL